jgi:cytochrome P450
MTATLAKQKRLPPGPRGIPMVGQLVAVGRDRLGFIEALARDYGDAARFRMGPKVLYLFNHPDYARHVLHDNHANYHKGIGLVHAKRALGEGLLTSDGDWRAQRHAIQPAFQRERVAGAAVDVIEEAAKLVQRWRERDPATPVDVVAEMTRFTLAVLGRVLLDTDLASHEAIGEDFSTIQDQAMFEMMTLNAVPPWLPTPRNRRFHKARADLEQLVNAMIDERAGQPDDENDLVSRLLVMYRAQPTEALRRRRMCDELVTLLLAGHETTSSTLGWTWYMMDQHPDVADRVRDEARAVLGDRTPTFEDLHELRYTTMVVQESMRLYPAVWVLPRKALADDEIGGYHVPAGADVLISPYTLHRNPAFWDDPLRFDPERFSPASTVARQRYTYIPFGGGPRVCVGSNLGMAEAVLVTAMVARELRLRLKPGHRVVGEAMLSLRVRGGLPMMIQQAPQ